MKSLDDDGPESRLKRLQVDLPHCFQVICFFFDAPDFHLRSLALLELLKFENGGLRLCIQLF